MEKKDTFKNRNYDNLGLVKSQILLTVPETDNCSIVVTRNETIGGDDQVEYKVESIILCDDELIVECLAIFL